MHVSQHNFDIENATLMLQYYLNKYLFIYLKCLGIHEDVLGTVQNHQDTVPVFKNIQSRILILLGGYK